MQRRLMTVTALVAILLLCATPARATLTKNDIGCAGSADIVDGSKTYRVDADDETAKVPRQGSIHWKGSVETITHNHHGVINLHLLGFKVRAWKWGPSANASSLPESEGDKTIPSVMKSVPPGKYVVDGFHRGNEGGCAGHVIIDVQGSPLSSPVGIVGVIGTLVTAGGLLLAARPRGV